MSTPGTKVQVIDRAVLLLDALAGEPMTLTHLSRQTGIAKGTVFRLLDGLSTHGLVIKDPQGNDYLLGPGFLRFVQGSLSGLGTISTLGRGVMQCLQSATGESVALHAQLGLERVCIGDIPSSHPIRYSSTVGSSAPLSVGAAGRVLLSILAPPVLNATLASLVAVDPRIDIAVLRAEVEATRTRGHCVSHGERLDGAEAVSVPVTTSAATLALTVLGPSDRMSDAVVEELISPLTHAAHHLRLVLDEQTPESELTP